MSHVRSCMPTCICPFLAVYAEAILEGLGLARSQLSTSEGWGASCNRQNIARQLLTLFCGTYYRCCQVMSGNDSYFDIYKTFFTLSCTITKEEHWCAIVQTWSNGIELGVIVKSWFKVDRFPRWLQYLTCCWIYLKVIIKMVMWSVSCLLWCIIITILYYTCMTYTEASAPSVPSLIIILLH